jgi:hypothetical protein
MVLSNCLWVFLTAWQATKPVIQQPTRSPSPKSLLSRAEYLL